MSDWGVIALRWALYGTLGLLAGLPVFARLSGRNGPPLARSPYALVLLILVILGILLSAFGFLQQVAAMAGSTVGQIDAATFKSLLNDTALGLALKVRLVALATLSVLMIAALREKVASWWIVASLGAIALGTVAWSGHGAATDGPQGWIHLAADIVHLVAASVWIGSLVGFLVMLRRARDARGEGVLATAKALAAFASTGTVLVAVLVATGLVNGWYILRDGDLLVALAGPYGQLLAVKLLLFAVMVGLAALNRFRLTPALESAMRAGEPGPAVAGLQRSIVFEFAVGMAILFLVGWLGTLDPFPSA